MIHHFVILSLCVIYICKKKVLIDLASFEFEIESALQKWDRKRKDATCTDTHAPCVCQLPKYNCLHAHAHTYTLALITDAVYIAPPVQDLNYPTQSYFP